MLIMAGAGVYLAIAKSRSGDVLGGTLTLYLVATSWVTVRRRNRTPGVFDWCALVAVFALLSLTAIWAAEAFKSPTGMKNGYPPGPFLFLGSVALIAMIGDIRIVVKGRISGVRRIARHLWRMCFALFIASIDFPGTPTAVSPLYAYQRHTLCSQFPAADSDDLLAIPSAWHPSIEQPAGARYDIFCCCQRPEVNPRCEAKLSIDLDVIDPRHVSGRMTG